MKFSLTKKVILALASCSFFAACIFETKETSKITISIDETSLVDTVMAGDTLALNGIIKGEGKLKIQLLLKNSVGDNVYGSKLLLLPTPADSSDTDGFRTITADNTIDLKESNYKVVTFAGITNYTCAGMYEVKIEGGIDADGGVTGFEEKYISFRVQGINCDTEGKVDSDLTSKTDTIAVDSNLAGSAFDFDAFKDYKIDEFETNSDKLDLYYGSVTRNLTQVIDFFNPKVIVEAGVDTTKWKTRNNTKFYKLTQVGSGNFANIKSKYQIQKLWDESQAKDRVQVGQGDVYIIKTSKGTLGLVHVKTKVGSDATSYAVLEGLLP